MRKVLFTILVVLLILGGSTGLVLNSDAFWRWAGHKLLALANERLQGELSVVEIAGTPFRGYVFKGVKLTTPQGEMFQAKGVLLQLSFWSLFRLEPVIDKVALYNPILTLEHNRQGQWNVSQLVQPRQGASSSAFPLTKIKSLTFSQILINNGSLLVQEPGSSQHFTDLNVNVNLKVFQPLSPQPRLELGLSRLAATTPWGCYSLETRLTYSDHQVKLASLVLATDSQQLLFLSGEVFLDDRGTSNLTGDIGPVPPALVARFYHKWPCDWKVIGKVRLYGKSSDLQFGLDGTIHQAVFDLSGRLNLAKQPEGYDVRLKLAKVTPEMLADLDIPGSEVYCEVSPLSVNFHLQGSGLVWPPPEFSWQFQAEPFTFQNARVEQLDLKAAGSAARQTLGAVFAGNSGSLTLNSQGSFFTAPQGEIKLQMVDFEPGLLGLKVPEQTYFTADFAGRFNLPEMTRPDSLMVGGEIKASGCLGGYPLEKLQGRFTWEKPKLTLQAVRAELGNVATELKGTLDGDRLDFSFKGETVSGGNWPVPDTLKGSVTWNGNVQGTVSEPDYTLQARGQGLTVGSVALQSFALGWRGQGLPPRSGALDAKAAGVKTPAGTFEQVKVTADGTGARWRFHLNSSSPPPGPLAEFIGNVDLGSRPLSLVIERLNLHLAGISVQNRSQVQARFLPGLELPTTAFNVNGGTVQVSARLQGDQAAGHLEVRQLPLEIAGVKALQGKIQGQVTLSGSARNPQLEGAISLAPLQWEKFSVKSIGTSLSYRGGVGKISGKAQGPEGIQVSWDGKMPLQLSLLPFAFNLPESGLEFRIESSGANLKLVEKFVPEIAKADCPVDLQVRVKGNWRRPEVEAQIHWQEGYLTLRQAGIPYSISPGSINWQGNKLSLPQLTLESGGTMRLSGDIDFSGYQPQRVKARTTLDNFKILENQGSEAYLNGEGILDGPWSALVLRGQLTIPQATINPALVRPSTRQHPDIVLVRQKKPEKATKEQTQEARPDFYKNMKIALSLEAPNNVWIKQKTPEAKAEVEVSLDVRVKKQPGEDLAVGGMVRSLEGTIDIFDKEFKVEKAIVTLPGVPKRQPYVEARIVHEMSDATLLVDVSGPANKPHIDLSSTPPMPANDLMSYLIYGRPAGLLSQQEFNAEQQAAGVLGGITASKIQEILGSDFPILGNVTVKSTTGSIGLVKPLTRGVNLSVERRTNPTAREDPTQVRLEYRINRYLRLQAEQGQRNTGGDVLFKYDY